MADRLPPVVQTAGLCKTFKDFWRRPRVEAVKDLDLEIPPGTQPNAVLNLKREGMPNMHGHRRGDLLVRVEVEVPSKVSDQLDELLRMMAEVMESEVGPRRRGFMDRLKDAFRGTEDEENHERRA